MIIVKGQQVGYNSLISALGKELASVIFLMIGAGCFYAFIIQIHSSWIRIPIIIISLALLWNVIRTLGRQLNNRKFYQIEDGLINNNNKVFPFKNYSCAVLTGRHIKLIGSEEISFTLCPGIDEREYVSYLNTQIEKLNKHYKVRETKERFQVE